MNKEALRKLLEDCWDASWEYYVENGEVDVHTYITSQLSAMEQGEGENSKIQKVIDWLNEIQIKSGQQFFFIKDITQKLYEIQKEASSD